MHHSGGALTGKQAAFELCLPSMHFYLRGLFHKLGHNQTRE